MVIPLGFSILSVSSVLALRSASVTVMVATSAGKTVEVPSSCSGNDVTIPVTAITGQLLLTSVTDTSRDT